MICHRLLHPLIHHAWPLAYRAIRRAMLRHAHRVIGAGVTVVCVAGPPLVVLHLTPPIAPAALDVPLPLAVPVPEPGSLAVLAVGVVAVVIIRNRRA